jgi:hypothetical protein
MDVSVLLLFSQPFQGELLFSLSILLLLLSILQVSYWNTISSGASFVGSFDTTYSIVGGIGSMAAYKDLIISTITEDFDNSPTVGYVNNTSSSSASQANLISTISS